MDIFVPGYFTNFKCTASNCKHNCCVGWEIDIDDDMFDYYMQNPNISSKLVPGEYVGDEYIKPHFRLKKDGRCPFLNEKNLCNIITEIGEDKLCQICYDHPRFVNYYANRVEIGLGLCCEAAADLIINYQEKFSLIKYNDLDDLIESPIFDCNDKSKLVYNFNYNEAYLNEEKAFFSYRNQIISIVSDEDWSFSERVNNLFDFIGVNKNAFIDKLSEKDLFSVYMHLERLNPIWESYLYDLKSINISTQLIDFEAFVNVYKDLQLEQILVYFLYRHMSGTLDDDLLLERICLSVISTYIICIVASTQQILITEAARLYSAEIEYSDENIDELLYLIFNIIELL